MPTVVFAHGRSFLSEHAGEYPYLVVVPIDEPRPSAVEDNSDIRGRWIAAAVDGMMHWRFAEAADAEIFREEYGSF